MSISTNEKKISPSPSLSPSSPLSLSPPPSPSLLFFFSFFSLLLYYIILYTFLISKPRMYELDIGEQHHQCLPRAPRVVRRYHALYTRVRREREREKEKEREEREGGREGKRRGEREGRRGGGEKGKGGGEHLVALMIFKLVVPVERKGGGKEEERRRKGGGKEEERRRKGGGKEEERRRKGGGKEEERRRKGGGKESRWGLSSSELWYHLRAAGWSVLLRGETRRAGEKERKRGGKEHTRIL